jgi:hypothetical protein
MAAAGYGASRAFSSLGFASSRSHASYASAGKDHGHPIILCAPRRNRAPLSNSGSFQSIANFW